MVLMAMRDCDGIHVLLATCEYNSGSAAFHAGAGASIEQDAVAAGFHQPRTGANGICRVEVGDAHAQATLGTRAAASLCLDPGGSLASLLGDAIAGPVSFARTARATAVLSGGLSDFWTAFDLFGNLKDYQNRDWNGVRSARSTSCARLS